MKFSVLIANYNNGKYFKDCWESLLAQTEQDFEVVIVDDASTDDSVHVIKEIVNGDKRVSLYFNDTNKGCGFTKHKCATLAKSPISGFLDPDDTLEPQAISVMIKAHMQSLECSIVHSKYKLVDLDLNLLKLGEQGGDIPDGKTYLTYGKGAITAFASFKTDLYIRSGGISPNFKRAVDQDLYYKLEEQGATVFINEYLYNYRVTPQSISCNKNEYKATYWHIEAMKDAVRRRGMRKDEIFVFRLMQKEFEYIKERMNKATSLNRFCVRYFFLYRLFNINFRYQLRGKIYAFFMPNSYFK